jgi:peptidoglycan/xylan/chitin deacetylase (PgdA/CDA1 family)
MEQAFSRILGVKPAFMRPPYGNYNNAVRTVAFSRGQSLALWDHDTEDADGATVAYSKNVYAQAVSKKTSSMVVLNHETEATTAGQVLPYALNLLKSHGYQMVTLAECLGLPAYQSPTGKPQTRTSSWTCDNTPEPGKACGGSIPCETGTVTA